LATHPHITAFIALGANLGQREQQLRDALSRLDATPGVRVIAVSRFIETAAVGGPVGGPAFLNAAAKLDTTLAAHPLLHELLRIERELGRSRREKWEPRLIDLDLLLYGDRVLSSQELVVPHPLMHERLFVLEPLAEIAPEVVHPVLNMTIRGLLDNARRDACPLSARRGGEDPS
jgi:2-amino-4-hydroxy-6-hydroxymethyldihydropteridine diphosphokinase